MDRSRRHLHKRSEELLREILCRIEEILDRIPEPSRIVKFKIKQRGATNMADIIGIAPGASATFDAVPLDKNGSNDSLPAGIVPVWTSSDTVNAPVVAAADGMSATVAVAASAPAGVAFTLSVSATLTDGTVPAGTASVPVFALEVASFKIVQRPS